MADARPPDYDKYTKSVARGAKANNARKARYWESEARVDRSMIHTTDRPERKEYYRDTARQESTEARNRRRAGRSDWSRSVALKKSGRGKRKSTR